tara:strand:- start:309 stop:1241 length:933 start_codon:yes stop_codon:yes gene_type:complete
MNILNNIKKFSNPNITLKGLPRARVTLNKMETLWFNTGTLCNVSCKNCYIESSPKNKRLVYLKSYEVSKFLNELKYLPNNNQIGFTGGEPFMNPDIMFMINDSLSRGYKVLVLSNGMKPMHKHFSSLIKIKDKYNDLFKIRISLDHYNKCVHESNRGPNTWGPVIYGLHWLNDNGFKYTIACRQLNNESEIKIRKGFSELVAKENLDIDVSDNKELVLFPEMEIEQDTPEITENCWKILDVNPESLMCSNSRMVVKKNGSNFPNVQACTLIAYEEEFNLGLNLKESVKNVSLNHPFCSQFCVLGKSSCSN